MAQDKIGTGYYQIEADLTKIKAQLQAFQKQVSSKKLNLNMSNEMDKVANSTKKVKTSFGSALKEAMSLQRVVNRMAFLGTVGAVYALGNALKESLGEGIAYAEEFNDSLKHIFTVMDSGIGILYEFKEELKDVSKTFAIDLSKTSKSLYDIISGRIGESSAINVLNESSKLATANMAELSDVTNTLVAILNSYNIAGRDSAEISDKLQMAIKMGKMEMQDFASSLGKVIPQAATYNISIDEMFGVLATMTNQGMKAREAVTSFNRAITAWSQDSQMAYILQKEGIQGVVNALSLMSIQEQKTLSGGVRGVKTLNAFMNNYAKTLENIKSIRESTGATEEALNKQTKSITFEINQQLERNKQLWMEIGEELLPIKKDLLDLVGNLTKLLSLLFKIIIPIYNKFKSIFNILNEVLKVGKEVYKSFNMIGESIASLLDNTLSWITGQDKIQEQSIEIIEYERMMIRNSKKIKEETEETNELLQSRFLMKQRIAKIHNAQIEYIDSQIKLLEKQLKIEEAYGRDTTEIQEKLINLNRDKLYSLEAINRMAGEYSSVLGDIYDTQLEIAKLQKDYNDLFWSSDIGKFYDDLLTYLDKIENKTMTVKTWFESLMSGADMTVWVEGSDKAIFSLKNYIQEHENLIDIIKTSREDYDDFYNFLYEKNEVLAEYFRKTFKRPDEQEEQINTWKESFTNAVEDMRDAFSTFIADEISAWAEMVIEGKNAWKSFHDFFDRLLSSMVSAFVNAMAKMLAEWVATQVAMAATKFAMGGFDPSSLYSIFAGDFSGISPNNAINAGTSVSDMAMSAFNNIPEINNQNNINVTLNPSFSIGRKASGYIVKDGNRYNKMSTM